VAHCRILTRDAQLLDLLDLQITSTAIMFMYFPKRTVDFWPFSPTL